MPSPRTALYLICSTLIFIASFCVISTATFYILWLYVFGDSHGGRWQHLAWPVAFVGAGGCVVLFYLRVIAHRRLRAQTYLSAVALFLILSAAWIHLAGSYFFPPVWKIPSSQRPPHSLVP